MSARSTVTGKVLVLLLTVSTALLAIPVRDLAQAQTAPAATDGILMGYIYEQDMRTPVRNVVVKLRNVTNFKEYESEPTNPLGMYTITAVEEGRYLMGVQAPNGAYNFQYSLYLKGDETAKLSVALNPTGFAPIQGEESGEGGGKGPLSFFKSPAGILTLIVAAEIVLFATVLIEKEPSPIR